MIGLEPINDLSECRVVLENETVPKCPLGFTVLVLGSSNRLRETEEGQSKIDESVLVVVHLSLIVDDLVELKADETSHERGRRSNGRNDLSCDLFGGVAISWVNPVVHGTEIGSGGNKVDVVVSIIVLLELDGRQSVPCQGRWRW